MNPYDDQTISYAFPGVTLGAMPAGSGGRAAKLDDATQAEVTSTQTGGPWPQAHGMGYDDVIDPRDLRDALLRSLLLLEDRDQRHYEPVDPRRHPPVGSNHAGLGDQGWRGRRRQRGGLAGAPTSECATDGSSRSGRSTRPAARTIDADGTRRRTRLRRRPHALRRAGVLGSDAQPVAAARCHDRRRRQLRIHDRAARAERGRVPHEDARPRRGDAARRARGGCAVGLDDDGRVLRPLRRTPSR